MKNLRTASIFLNAACLLAASSAVCLSTSCPSRAAVQQAPPDIERDDSKATLEETVKWLTDNMMTSGSYHVANVDLVGVETGTFTSLTLNKDTLVINYHVKRVTSVPPDYYYDKSTSIPLRDVTRVVTSDFDSTKPTRLTIICEHNSDITEVYTNFTNGQADCTRTPGDEVLWFNQKFEFVQRIEKAMRHLAKLARAMPVEKSNEPF